MNAESKKPQIFKFRGKMLHITIHRHLAGAEDPCLDFIRKLSKISPKLKAINEVGKTGHAHSHIVALWPERIYIGSKRKWERLRTLGKGVNLTPISDDEHMGRALGYGQAEKKGGEKSKSVVVLDELKEWEPTLPYHEEVTKYLLNVKSWQNALVGPFSDYICQRMNWAREVYLTRPVPQENKRILTHVLPWQRTTIGFVEAHLDAPCRRTIHWIWDRRGHKGKSDLVTHFAHKYNAMVYDGGRQQDMASAYDGQRIVCFDLCRESEDYCPYRTMEAFKNGRIFSPKYVSALKNFVPPHVLVFANWPPRDGDKKISKDQWNVVKITENFKLSSPLTMAETRCAGYRKRLKTFLTPLNPDDRKKCQGVLPNVIEPPGNLAKTARPLKPKAPKATGKTPQNLIGHYFLRK